MIGGPRPKVVLVLNYDEQKKLFVVQTGQKPVIVEEDKLIPFIIKELKEESK